MSDGTSSSSLRRLMSVLDVFSEVRPTWTTDEMVEELGYAKPTLYRYLRILADSGLVASGPHGVFTLGPRVVELDFLMRLSDRLVVEGRGEVERLAQDYPCTAFIARWYRDRMLCVYSEAREDAPLSSYARGRAMPMDRGALARAIIAHLPRRKIQDLLERYAPEGDTEGYLKEQTSLLRAVRRQGYALAFGEVTPGVTAMASPIFGDATEPVGALCVTMRQGDCPEEVRGRLAMELPAAARSIGAHLRQPHPMPEMQDDL